MINILSVDFDYFVKASMEERFTLFPDGTNENYPESIQIAIWLGHYLNLKKGNGKTLKEIEIDKDGYNLMKELLINQKDSIKKIRITKSHSKAYEFIKEISKKEKSNDINLINVDFHHDIYKSLEGTVDCENWLDHIMLEYKDTNSKFMWIKRENSDMPDENRSELCNTLDLSIINKYKWDYVFICKSNPWTPPHLDKYFVELCNCCGDCDKESEALEDRYTEIKDGAEEIEEKMRKNFNMKEKEEN